MNRQESFKTKLHKLVFNLYPSYRRTGGRVTFIANDGSEIRVKIPLNWKTRNYVGTIFGGSLYGAVDPMYMVMLIKRLGSDYIVWDKTATINFKKPGRSTLYATFVIDDTEINLIREKLDREEKLDCHYSCDLVDEEGTIHATVEKVIYIRKKN